MQEYYDNLIAALLQPVSPEAGGVNNPPETRLLMGCLVKLINAQNVLELGYDFGYTTEALACTGANVVGVDDWSEYKDGKPTTVERLSRYPNVTLLECDALDYLKGQIDGAFDFIFVDDGHDLEHVQSEMVELKRVVRLGGIVVFHDPLINRIKEAIE